MIALRVSMFLLLFLVVGADKKIELQDIEEDNLRSEKEKDIDKYDNEEEKGQSRQELVPLEFLKNGLLRYFENPTQAPPQQRYVHQYAVTEPPERAAAPPSIPQYTTHATQQAMIGYLSNVPMQIYLVPQYYTDQPEQANTHPGPPYQNINAARPNGYHSASEAVQTQTNYVEVPAYVTPTSKPYVPKYTQALTYIYPTEPTAHKAAAIAPVVAYRTPVVQYQQAVAAPATAPKVYYQSPPYETNTVEEVREQEEQKHYTDQTEVSYQKHVSPELRYYNSRTPIRNDYSHSTITELPRPHPLLLKSAPPHLSHIPKTLPMYRPFNKPIYQTGSAIVSSGFTHRPHEVYGPPPPFKRRPTSLLDSYIPSSVQVEYLRRGLVKEPLAAYDAVVAGGLHHPIPRHYERGFLPNQMYHTGAGGVTFGHFKRTPKIDKVSQ